MLNFTSLLIIGAVAVLMPLLLGLFPAVKVPAVVLEIVGGVLVGPTVLGWVHLNAPGRPGVRGVGGAGPAGRVRAAADRPDHRRPAHRDLADGDVAGDPGADPEGRPAHRLPVRGAGLGGGVPGRARSAGAGVGVVLGLVEKPGHRARAAGWVPR